MWGSGGGRGRAPAGAPAIIVICVALSAACSGDGATAPSSSAQTALAFCPGNVPIWLAYQDDRGQWTRAMPDANDVFHVSLPDRAAIAFVDADSTGFAHILQIEYATASELALQLQCKPAPSQTKVLAGSVAGLDSSESARISLGTAAAEVGAADSAYSLHGVRDGPLDLLALGTDNPYDVPARIAIRRGVNVADGARIPMLDFASSEAVAPAAATLTIGGMNGDLVDGSVEFTTATGTWTPLMNISALGATVPYGGVPTALLAPGDMHSITLLTNDRSAVSWFHSVDTRTLALGPSLDAPVSAVADTAPYVRPRLQLRVQSDYASALVADWYEDYTGGAVGPVEVFAVVSAGYLQQHGATWDFTVPDLSSAGFEPAWGLRSGTPVSLNVTALGGASVAQILGAPADGLTYRSASWNSTASRLSVRRRATIALQRLRR